MLNYQHGGFVRWSAWYGIRLRNFQHILVQIIIIVFIGCCKFFYAYGAPRKETSFYWNIQQKYSQEKSREFTNLAIVIENPTIRPNWNINLTDYPNIRILRYWKNMHKNVPPEYSTLQISFAVHVDCPIILLNWVKFLLVSTTSMSRVLAFVACISSHREFFFVIEETFQLIHQI